MDSNQMQKIGLKIALMIVTTTVISCGTDKEVSCSEPTREMNFPPGISINKVLEVDSLDNLKKIHMINTGTGFLFARSTKGDCILRTTDGGASWTGNYIKIGRKYTYNGEDFFFLNENIGFVTSYDEHSLLRTSDAGISWDTISTPLNSGIINHLQKDDLNHLYATLSNYPFETNSIIKSSDQGLTWSTLIDNCGWALQTVDNQLFSLSDNSISVFDLNGNPKTEIDLNFITSIISDWFVEDEQNTIVSTPFDTYKTNDAGKSWSKVFSQGSSIIHFSGEGSSLLVKERMCSESDFGVHYSTTAYSTDGGQTWDYGMESKSVSLQGAQELERGRHWAILNNTLYEIVE